MVGKRLPLTAIGALAVLILAGAGASAAETAVVHISIPPQRIETNITLNLDTTSALTGHRFESHVTDIAQGTATGSVTIAPAYATGSVRFRYVCPAMTAIYPCPLPYTLAAGTIVATFRGVKFLTQAPVTFTLGGGQEQTAAIGAIASGAAGNQSPGAIELLPNGPRQISVFNPLATSGGVDGGTAMVVQQSDIESVRSALATRLTDDLNGLMAAQTGGLSYVAEGPPTNEIASDHAAGDQAAAFTLTMTGTLVAYTFSSQDAQAMLRTVMQPMVWPGYELGDPIQANFGSVQGTTGIVSIDAVGYATPKPSPTSLRAQLTGLGVTDAYGRIRQDFPGSSVQIQTAPLQLPWLPVMDDHITVMLTLQQVGPVFASTGGGR